MILKNIFKYKNTCFYIGKGVIQLADSCIPIKAISGIDVKEVKDTSLIPALVLIVLGVIFYLPGGMWQVMGTVIVVVGIAALIVGVLWNFYRPHYLKIQVHSKKVYQIAGKDIGFVRKSMEIVREKIEDDQEGIYYLNFTDMEVSHAENMDMVKLVMNNGRMAELKEGEDFAKKWKSMFFVRTRPSEYVENMGQGSSFFLYTDDEWQILEDFFEKRCGELGMANEKYKPCQSLRDCSREKDAVKMHKTIKEMTKTTFQAVLGEDVDKSIQKLLLKVLKMR
ncbi:MAG: hypothetical protein NC307_00395 [Roseburia sp.]|nr:hypothetical protein [Roseburia sp.]